MTKKQIEKYLSKHGMNANQRLEKNNGGQYLNNFLHDFSKYVTKKYKSDMIGAIRKIDIE